MADLFEGVGRVVVVVVVGLGIPGDEAGVTWVAAWLTSILGDGGFFVVLVMGEKVSVQGVIDVGLYFVLFFGYCVVGDEDV